MKTVFWLDQIPLNCVFLFTVVIVLLSIAIGTFFGIRRSRKPDHETESSIGTIIGSTLGLLAFLLAITWGFTAERLQARRQLLLDEVNALGTAYLRAGLLLEPHRSDIQKMLRDYVDARINITTGDNASNPEKMQQFISATETLQDKMWTHAVDMAKADRSSEIDALFIDSLNTVIDLHTSRLTAFGYRIPFILWNVLYAITILSMLIVGYQAGLSGKKTFKIGIVLALIFSSVVYLIADMDRAGEGHLRVNQKPMIDLQQKMQADIP